ncbi:immunoreactive mannoprotein MP88 [Cryptococcus neoformans C23]|uniref:Immunoreactive mannoprotein MP88 n=1 Tax=Cryptococcus neoformans (strain H99 / ATCC 208821 / CBS 10515 / FGSC 9487) TaxID=235443 RepID=J9VF18_CRYN9|nr:immunoreactive mannoprotein MP88 [Cryptococcus neoformans var. grubii H99]AUB22387.1 immunoreactive mannoprotein MP88 [Cryptococcus neoformans var. grubii]OWZ36690.1 immunoreactive mannoprotein MP88 [Cryptococcus neoformans var. grubii AD2-60a]OWZ48360.1 immunoreactive mannoprotein MP88 [Cryptococcus neoformans var. grubii C23]OXC86989.1 immunoreactive mannoprotein MP88 [Cryptococcus neoformans var. grubii AD1-7a]OXG45718.1 immunoreactive mannoprotein MP88 [Cryptococcus neoformans var. grub|eukprot:XP_012046953.1 immunoreactive mannoprotein MP88 [Cryptococcus neoformans var. grubii H99]
MISKVAVGAAAALMAGVANVNAQVTATGTMGPTNPPEPTLGTPINQTSYARLLSLNAIDDFCLFAPPVPNSVIGETEAEEVAWCVQPRNNARVIPDGVLTAVHFVKTPLYWQIQGFGDFTHLNIQSGDEGGELDPHGATGLGNPVGGNVTTNATGSDVSYEEWMNYMAADQFCLRICISENSTYSAANECQHTLDEMGCSWVMPGDYTADSFTECDGDSAYPPGWYILGNGSTSTFQQRYTGTFTGADGSLGTWTQGETVTPQSAYSTPASSNCKTYTSVGNGIASLALSNAGSVNSTASATNSSSGGSSAAATRSSSSGSSAGSGSGSAVAGSTAAASSSGESSSSTSAAMSSFNGISYGTAMAVVALVAGAGSFLL